MNTLNVSWIVLVFEIVVYLLQILGSFQAVVWKRDV
jgi:hypothetical protein